MKRYAGFALIALGAATVVVYTLRKRRGPEDILRAYFAAWESGDLRRLDGVVGDGYVGHIKAISGTDDRDRDALAEQLQAHAEAFTESTFEVEDVMRDGDKVAARVRLEAVHADDGRDVEMDGLVMVRIDGGRIVEEWASWDYLGLAEQLGVELSVNPPA